MSTVRKSAGFEFSWGAAWTYEDSSGSAGASLQAEYEDDADGWQGRLPAKGSVPPARVGAEFSGFRLTKRRVTRENGDKVKALLTYEAGLSVDETAGVDDPIPRYSFEITLSEEVILTHERYKDLVEEEQMALVQIIAGERYKTEEGKEEWRGEIESDLGLEVLAKIEKGTTAHREPGLIWVESKRIDWADLDDEVALESVRKIDDMVPGDPPTGGDRDYMYLGAQVDQDESGEFADIVKKWEMSGPEGWDEDLYGEEPAP